MRWIWIDGMEKSKQRVKSKLAPSSLSLSLSLLLSVSWHWIRNPLRTLPSTRYGVQYLRHAFFRVSLSLSTLYCYWRILQRERERGRQQSQESERERERTGKDRMHGWLNTFTHTLSLCISESDLLLDSFLTSLHSTPDVMTPTHLGPFSHIHLPSLIKAENLLSLPMMYKWFAIAKKEKCFLAKLEILCVRCMLFVR